MHLPLLEDRDLVGHGQGLDLVVGHVDDCRAEAAVDAGELGAHLDAKLEVEVRQRLVHEKRARTTDQRPGQGDPLHLTA
ncbi:hypothetical protein Jiend_52510 [Micromonospora endophytica]|nr:hypothetical protein Jiend_52510 [Micromonospora endophytica]